MATMGMARYLVDAYLLEGQRASDLAVAHGVHRSWIYKLVARYKQGGYEALEPKSRKPHSCPHQTRLDIQEEIIQLRQRLERLGHDHGPLTIRHYLVQSKGISDVPSVSTIWRVLKRAGLVTPQPQKKPRSAYIRFEAGLPNEMWQADITYWKLADKTRIEVLNFLDDHSRFLLASDAYLIICADDVLEAFHKAAELHGHPQSLLTDNGAVFTADYLRTYLQKVGVVQKNSAPYHPQTCGKIERYHQTLKKYLYKQNKPRTLQELQFELDRFANYYNNQRPHRALKGITPLDAYKHRVKAKPLDPQTLIHYKPHHHQYKTGTYKVDKGGQVTLRYHNRNYHIGIGRAHKGKQVRLLIKNKQIRVINQNGQLIRQLTLDTTRKYQPQTQPKVSTMNRDTCLQ